MGEMIYALLRSNIRQFDPSKSTMRRYVLNYLRDKNWEEIINGQLSIVISKPQFETINAE